MDEEQAFPLLEQLKHYNLEFLLPKHFESDDDDEAGWGHTYSEIEESDPTQDEYYDQFAFEGEEEVEAANHDNEDDYGVKNLDDFCRLFNIDYLDYDDLLNMNIWDLFGITKKQFDLIDWQWISEADFPYFFSRFTEETRELPVEKKILYSIADTITDYRNVAITGRSENKEARLAYLERIIDNHSLGNSQDLIGLLADYWRFYPDAITMNRRREAAGEQPFKYEEMPKPSHIKDLHHKAFQDHMTLETERLSEDRKQLNGYIKEVSEMKDYKRFLYTDGKYIVKAVESQDDLDYEGKYLEHCVASYGSYMAQGQSYIYFVRRADAQDTPFFTAEILPPEKRGDRFKLNQLYTFRDTITKTADLREFIRDWSIKKGFTIKCRI